MKHRDLTTNRRFSSFAARATAVFATVGYTSLALAYPGEKLLNFAAQYVIAPLGIFAVLLILAGSLFNSQMTRGAIYAAVICAFLFGIIKLAPQLMTAFSS